MSALADQLWQARQEGRTVPVPEGLALDAAYAVAARNHARRLARGERAVSHKIGHNFPASWAEQGIAAPSWGWLYASSTGDLEAQLDLCAWRAPKAEVELVLRLSMYRRPEAMALGIEIVDRPYPSWGFPVAASVAATGRDRHHGGAGVFVAAWRGRSLRSRDRGTSSGAAALGWPMNAARAG